MRWCWANKGGTTGVPLVPALDEGFFIEEIEEGPNNEDEAPLSPEQLYV
jgi:hypothetical protein